MTKETTLTDDVSNKEYFGNGVRASLPIVLGYGAIGLVVGVVARTAGLTVAEVTFMSLILYAGSAQLIVVSLIGVGVSAPAIVFTIFLVEYATSSLQRLSCALRSQIPTLAECAYRTRTY